MTIRHKLFALVGLSILMVGVLFFVFRMSAIKMETCEIYGRNLQSFSHNILEALVAEKEYLKTHDQETAKRVTSTIDRAASEIAELTESDLFSPDEIASLEESITAYRNAFQTLCELTVRVDKVRARIDADIGGFNDNAVRVVEKVDEAVSNAFMEGEVPDVNLQSLSDTTRTAIFLMTKITLSMSRDLFLSNNSEKFSLNTGKVFDSLKSIKINIKALAKRLKSDDESYFRFIKETQSLIDNLPDQVTVIGQLWPQLMKVEAQMEILSQQVLDKATAQAAATKEKADAVNKQSLWAGVIGFFAVVLAMIIGGGLIVRSITSAIGKVIKSLALQADQVSSVSGQVSAASQSLAEGSSEQAATLEETSSSMEQMSSQTKHNADNSKQADLKMTEAIKVASVASESMQEMTKSMGEISSAGEEISHIIKTIDGIASQTNLLALNAAVEAARAGEAGAGFAVVADEVRSLALKTAEAARNTSQLIEDMIGKIDTGNELAKKTDVAFNQVSDSANGAAGLVGQITVASNEQAQGIDQVNTAVSQMDQVIQRNAANAEKTASLSEQLSAQSESLLEMVGSLSALVGGRELSERVKPGK
jgi:methyl-accepting chemotaxis protein